MLVALPGLLVAQFVTLLVFINVTCACASLPTCRLTLGSRWCSEEKGLRGLVFNALRCVRRRDERVPLLPAPSSGGVLVESAGSGAGAGAGIGLAGSTSPVAASAATRTVYSKSSGATTAIVVDKKTLFSIPSPGLLGRCGCSAFTLSGAAQSASSR